MKEIFCILPEDVQNVALRKVGRKLTEDELYQVKKGIEFGLEHWEEVVINSINELKITE